MGFDWTWLLVADAIALIAATATVIVFVVRDLQKRSR